VGDLFDAYQLIKDYMGRGSAFLFAFALLCAGQSASITVTLAGQVVSEGFLEWTVSPFLRRLITRSLGIIPSAIVSVSVGRRGLDGLLVGSQVALSIILPFVVFPLVWITSRQSGIMRVWVEDGEGRGRRGAVDVTAKTNEEEPVPTTVGLAASSSSNGRLPFVSPTSAPSSPPHPVVDTAPPVPASLAPGGYYEDFSSPWYMTVLGYTLAVVMLVANVYVIVELGLGQDG